MGKGKRVYRVQQKQQVETRVRHAENHRRNLINLMLVFVCKYYKETVDLTVFWEKRERKM